MREESMRPDADHQSSEDGDLGDLLQELRVLLQGVQVLTAFLILLPFDQGFAQIDQREKWIAPFDLSLLGREPRVLERPGSAAPPGAASTEPGAV